MRGLSSTGGSPAADKPERTRRRAWPPPRMTGRSHMRRLRPRSVYDVLALLSFFLVLGGGTALASYVVSSNTQFGPNTISGHKPPTGDHANVIAGSINGQDVADNSVRGADV